VLASITIENFRCIHAAQLEFDPQGTGILGRNASGKTSLLEAIYFLSHGRSLRTNAREKLMRKGDDFFRIVADLDTTRGTLVAGAEFAAGRTRMRLAGHDISSISSIAEILPVQLIDPGVHRLVEEGSARRRRLMDWGVFHVEHSFLVHWRRYQRALSQRNAVLRQPQPSDVMAWEREMAEPGQLVDRARADYLELLRPYFERLGSGLLGEAVTFEYRRGWARDQSLSEALSAHRARDQQLRATTTGPHRADLAFLVSGTPARDRVSRGQQKMLACAFVLAQVELRATTATVPTCLLLDDPAAELDVDNLGKLLRAIADVRAQLIVTSVSEAGLEGMNVRRRFHVEQGQFAPMI
jgi:DNA replication and repair protein RecF